MCFLSFVLYTLIVLDSYIYIYVHISISGEILEVCENVYTHMCVYIYIYIYVCVCVVDICVCIIVVSACVLCSDSEYLE